ncbi:hypothetical protein BDV27DRAFT_152098 [Aspergillus caelatus]|uniref:Uncharacterized protein n=1 Tax=Aspergillus caelatus TaxID=61420 RepID=A0A5N7AKP9_9EURO|nr:uncharacterized protein BDV27DRAFT_152098 [Aspergillus caelatus]KAE8370504.1 hypothetical protein BDV27DRAFT_152098 [Aspergillus caelatus]
MSSHPAHNELQPTGTTLPLELELEEDIEKELHHFVHLSRMGHYTEAHKLFDNTHGKMTIFSPVIAEYVDMLLEQGNYGRAAEVLEEHMRLKAEILGPDEMQLLRIMKSLADIYSKGAIHIYEIYINILRNQVLTRLYILLSIEEAAMDWRDLYSVLELQAVDCGNVVEYVHIWDLFTAWNLNPKRVFPHPQPNFPLGSDRHTLLLSQHISQSSSDPNWRNLLEASKESLFAAVYSPWTKFQ